MRALLVEDDPFKLKAIEGFLRDLPIPLEYDVARSVAGAMRHIEAAEGVYGLVFLDMSLPTFDIGPSESGGRPQGFGGINVLRELDLLCSTAKVIVVTQFEEFSEGGQSVLKLSDLGNHLREEFPSLFLGWVHFDHSSDGWKHELREHVARAVGVL